MMNSIIKHTVMWLSVATLLTGCNEITTVEEPAKSPEPQAIGFSGYHGWPEEGSRTAATGSTLFSKDDEIIVFATHTDGVDNTDFTSNFMKKQIVTFDGNAWTYSPIKYWPANGKLTFRGYYPSNVKFDEKNNPNNGKLYNTPHTCTTGFEPLYAVEATVIANNGKLTGDVSGDGKLQLGFNPLLNKINFTANVKSGLFDEVNDDEYTNCRFLLLNFKIWGFPRQGSFYMEDDSDRWTNIRSLYIQSAPLDLTKALVKQKVSEVVPGYEYNPSEGYYTESAVVIQEGAEIINLFNKALHLIPRTSQLSKYEPGFEIQYVVLTNKTDADGNNIYKESGIITRTISLKEIFNDEGISGNKNYHLIKKLININLNFSIDAVTVTRDLKDYTYKPMF